MSNHLDDMENYAQDRPEATANVDEWWRNHLLLRWLNYIPLRVVDRDFAKWRKSRVSPRRFRKIQQRLDRMYPPNKFGREADRP